MGRYQTGDRLFFIPDFFEILLQYGNSGAKPTIQPENVTPDSAMLIRNMKQAVLPLSAIKPPA
jgi:hypothetical protein